MSTLALCRHAILGMTDQLVHQRCSPSQYERLAEEVELLVGTPLQTLIPTLVLLPNPHPTLILSLNLSSCVTEPLEEKLLARTFLCDPDHVCWLPS